MVLRLATLRVHARGLGFDSMVGVGDRREKADHEKTAPKKQIGSSYLRASDVDQTACESFGNIAKE